MTPEFRNLGSPCIKEQAAIVVRKTPDGIEIIQDGDPFQSHDQIIYVSLVNLETLILRLQEVRLEDSVDG